MLMLMLCTQEMFLYWQLMLWITHSGLLIVFSLFWSLCSKAASISFHFKSTYGMCVMHIYVLFPNSLWPQKYQASLELYLPAQNFHFPNIFSLKNLVLLTILWLITCLFVVGPSTNVLSDPLYLLFARLSF